MDAILQKIKADIVSRPVVSILIIITVLASATLLTLALATLINISGPYDKSFKDLNGAHLWLHFNRNRIRERDIGRIESLPQVIESTGLRYNVRTRVQIGDSRVWVSLRVIPKEMPAVNRLLVQDGRYLNSHQIEILASKDLDYLYRLSVGDSITITRADGKEVVLPVIGLAYNPMWDTYRTTQPPYLYVTEETLRELFPDESTWDWSIGLRLADPQSVDETLALIESNLRPDAIDKHTDWRDVRTSAMFDAQLSFIFLGTFSFFAILATSLVVASSISSIVLSQFRQIGMLKAIGFTKNQILWLYIGQYLVLSLIGSLLGLMLGIALSPLPLQSVAVSLSTTFQPPFNILIIVLVLSIVPGIVVLTTLGSAYRGAKANIIKAIAVGAEAPHKKSFWGVRLAEKLNLPMTFTLGLDEVFVRPLRSLLTGLNLTLGVTGIVFGLALSETLNGYRADPSLLGIVHDAMVTREETSDGRTQHLLQQTPGVAAFYGQYLVEAETQDGEVFQVKAVEGDLAAFPFKIQQGRFFEPDTYEAIAGKGLLDWLDVAVGDELTLWLDQRPVTFQIVGQYPEPANAGQMLIVSLPTVARFVKEAKPDTYYLKLEPDFDLIQLRQTLTPKPDADLNLVLVEQAIPDSIIYLQAAIFFLSVIVIGIALVNVFNSSLLSVQEKLRTVGVLKTLGMTPAQVVNMINTTAGVLGFLATLAGIPLGLMLTKTLLSMLSDGYGFGEVQVTVKILFILLLIPLVVAMSMLGSLIPGRQAGRLPIVQVLRNE